MAGKGKIALMGRPRSGKDHVADLTGFPKYSLGEPLYDLVRHFYPGTQKNTPGFINLLKQFGQWGRACYNEEYPLTMERALMVEKVREIGPQLHERFEWGKYGRSPTLWAQTVLRRYQLACWGTDPPPTCIVPDLRHAEDMEFLRENGFDIYFVLCSHQTRWDRVEAVGEIAVWEKTFSQDFYTEHLHCGIVEYLNTKYSNYFLHMGEIMRDPKINEIFRGRVIWNDDRPPPEVLPGYFITVEEFLEKIREGL